MVPARESTAVGTRGGAGRVFNNTKSRAYFCHANSVHEECSHLCREGEPNWGCQRIIARTGKPWYKNPSN